MAGSRSRASNSSTPWSSRRLNMATRTVGVSLRLIVLFLSAGLMSMTSRLRASASSRVSSSVPACLFSSMEDVAPPAKSSEARKLRLMLAQSLKPVSVSAFPGNVPDRAGQPAIVRLFRSRATVVRVPFRLQSIDLSALTVTWRAFDGIPACGPNTTLPFISCWVPVAPTPVSSFKLASFRVARSCREKSSGRPVRRLLVWRA